jgi:hypothetical protein
MYAPREPNVRMKLEELPGRTSHSLPRAGARISYRDSGSSVLKGIALGNKDSLKSRALHSPAEPTRLMGTLSAQTMAAVQSPPFGRSATVSLAAAEPR